MNSSSLSTPELIKAFENASVLRAEALEKSDSESANYHFDMVHGLYKELKTRNALTSLLPLLEHPNPEVRLAASSRLLESSPEEAEPVLLKLAESSGILGLNAQLVLKEWKKGNLHFGY